MPSERSASILIVEDDVSYGASLESLLRLAGHRVRRVMDGVEAVRAIDEMSGDLDLVLCDLLLPRQSGFSVIRDLVTSGRTTQVVAMTGVYSSSEEVHSLRGLGIAGYLHKSTPFDEVLFRVNGLVRPSAVNTRRDVRVAVSVPVAYELEGRARHGTSYNLSSSGIYVRSSEPVPEGEVLELRLSLPTATEGTTVTADVIHSATPEQVRGTTYPAGFGAVFVRPSQLAQAAIRHFIEIVREEETTGERRARITAPAPV